MINNFSQSVECLTFEVSPFRECISPFYHSLLSPSPAIEQAPTFTFHINLILRQFARMFLIDNLSCAGAADLYELWLWFCMFQICSHILEDQSCFKSYAILKYFELFFSCICFRDLVTSRKANPVLKVSDPTLTVSLEKLLGLEPKQILFS